MVDIIYITIYKLVNTRKLSGISSVSPYTIFVYVHLFNDNIYLQNYNYKILSAVVQLLYNLQFPTLLPRT